MRIMVSHRNTDGTGISGGFGTVYYNLALWLSRLGNDVTVLTKLAVPSVEGPVFHRIHPAPEDSGKYAVSVARVVAELAPDVVECPSWGAECRLVPGNDGAPPIVVRGDIPALAFGEHDAAEMEQELMKSSTLTVAVSHAMAASITKTYGITVDRVIYNAVDTKVFQPSPGRRQACFDARERRIVWVGRASYMKGFDLLLDILAQSPVGFAYELVLGHAKYEIPLDFSGVRAAVRVHRGLPPNELINLYNECDIVLSTSRIEGFGLAVLEAMACGTPAVVPADSGGLAEIVLPGEGGEHYSNPAQAVDVMKSITTRHGLHAVARAALFTWERCAYETLATYEKAISLHS